MDRNFLDAASTVGGFGLSAVVAPPPAEAAGAALSTIISAGSPDVDSTFGLLFRLFFFFARTAISTSSDSSSAFLATRFFGMRVVLVAPPTLASSTKTLSLLLGFVFLDFDFLL